MPPVAATARPSALPAGFPLPTRYEVVSSVASGGQLLVVLRVSSAQDAYNFYKGALPGAGFAGAPRSAAVPPARPTTTR